MNCPYTNCPYQTLFCFIHLSLQGALDRRKFEALGGQVIFDQHAGGRHTRADNLLDRCLGDAPIQQVLEGGLTGHGAVGGDVLGGGHGGLRCGGGLDGNRGRRGGGGGF